MVRFLSICAGGALGTAARYLLVTWLYRVAGANYPWGTLAVNLIGSFMLGVLMELGLHSTVISPDVRITLAIGVLGGFTTYSSFNYETLRLAQGGAVPLAAANVAATLLGCWVAGLLGFAVGRSLARG